MPDRQPYPKDYATHIPILIGLSRVRIIYRVLEYGSGHYSTPLFLNKEVFSYVQNLVSCEIDIKWVPLNLDERLSVKPVDDNPDDWFDLVFVDADTESHKIDLIRLCGKECKGLTVIHDSEHAPYADAVNSSFNHVFFFNHFNPGTAIAYNQIGCVSGEDFYKLDTVIHEYQNTDPANVNEWLKIFKEHKDFLNA